MIEVKAKRSSKLGKLLTAGEARVVLGFVLTKALPGIAVFIATPYWVYRIGFSEYIIYSSGWALSAFVAGPFSSWVNQSLLRNTGNDSSTLGSLPRSSVLTTVLLSAGLGGSAIVLLIVAGSGFAVETALAVSLLTGATTFNSLQSAVLQRNFASGGLAWVLGLKTVGAVLLSIAFLEFAGLRTGNAVLWAFGIAAVLAVVFARTRYARFYTTTERRSKHVLRGFWRYGWPMAIWAAASTALLYSDRVALNLVLGAEEAGTYAATADLIVRGFSLIAFPITMYAHPLIMKAANNSSEDVSSIIGRMMSLVIILSAVFGAISTAAVFYGADLLGLESSLSVYGTGLVALGAGAWQVALISHKFMEVQNRTRELALIIVAIALCSFLLNLGLAPAFGLAAAPVVFSSSAVAYCAVTYLLGARRWARDNGRIPND